MVVINSFLSYLLLFVILLAIAIVASLIGIKLAKNKEAKKIAEAEQGSNTTEGN